MVLESLLELVETLRGRIDEHGALLGQNEMRTRYALIDPLLRELGWNTSDPSEVVIEDGSGDGRADYLLLAEGSPIMIIEAKRLGLGVRDGRQQAVNYAMDSGRRARYFTVTDGNQWEIYDTHQPAFSMMLISFELKEASPSEICLKTMALWRPAVEQGNAMVAEKPIFGLDTPRQTATIGIADNSNAMSEPSPTYTPASAPQPSALIPAISVPNTGQTHQGWMPLSELSPEPRSKPSELLFPDNSHIRITSWVSLTAETVRWLLHNNFLLENHYPVQVGKRYTIASNPIHANENRFAAPRQVEHLYIEGNYSAPHHVRNTKVIIERAGQDPSQFKVRLR